MKWAGRTIDVVQILLVSTHNYLRNTYLHISELELSPIAIYILLYDQSYSCNTPLSPHAYVLNHWVTLSSFRWKLEILVHCCCFICYLNHTAAITITAASLLIYRCGWEWRLNCQSLIGILVFPSCRTINLGNTSQRRLQRSPILVGIKTFSGAVAREPSFIGKTTCYHLFAALACSQLWERKRILRRK